MDSIGKRLKAWRDHESLSQKETAAHLCMPMRTYQDYERDFRSPGAESMAAFVKAGINANWLLAGIGPMFLADTVEKNAMPMLLSYSGEIYDNAGTPPGSWLVAVRERSRAELLATFDFFLAWKYGNELSEEAIKDFADNYNQHKIIPVSGLEKISSGWVRDLYIAWRVDDWALTGMSNITTGSHLQEVRDVVAKREPIGLYAARRSAAIAAAVKNASAKPSSR